MSCTAASATERISSQDTSLKWVNLADKQLTDAELAELADCLLAHPDVVSGVALSNNRLTDETGVKLAHYVAASAAVQWLDLSGNELGAASYLALAAALRVNSSLQALLLQRNRAVADPTAVDGAFVDALQLNPRRLVPGWWLYSDADEYGRLKRATDECGHPTMQSLLALTLSRE